MPSGRTHEAINLTAFGLLVGGYAALQSQGYTAEYDVLLAPETVGVFTAAYFTGTYLVTPDLDLAENHVRAKSNWGLLGLLWVPYGKLFSHRGLSHSWLIGPLTRLLYMVLVALAIGWGVSALSPYFGYTFRIRIALRENWQELAIGALAGYYLSQWLHLLADGIQPDHMWKGRKRRRRKR